ncbi:MULTISPECIES: hypothetical protein [Marichromatium]|uniref:Uncharacterized protein n=1 Tax=Marichromatium gracile TaxID=1048 RepID=A0A4R4A6F6_MARGR|nr:MULTISPECIES: hypothetical protein [Marichromatium]MBO8084859.1 hypothetical protein [Marichromatium sp.]MBK1709685.1 hypothetical protein [Marichromatium gracile]RNE90988.1 hypothetical protein EBL84_05005 [Marichromatium sp. AB31]RNE93763.1 hypothetical protein EBL85_05025 [Marichromatium sp. AB32]TCW34381.1 hypothetical protein EDC29_11198 [Marichromatium gracile]
MIGKLVLTLAVIAGAYLVVRARWRGDTAPGMRPGLPSRALRWTAAGLVVVMLGASGFYLLHDWQRGREVVEVRVLNVASGAETRYLARRGSVEGRRFRTLDGIEVRLADVERMLLAPAQADVAAGP